MLQEECYYLAAHGFVSYSFDDKFSALNANINSTHFLLAAIKNLAPRCRFYCAGSSEMFGHAEKTNGHGVVTSLSPARLLPGCAYLGTEIERIAPGKS